MENVLKIDISLLWCKLSAVSTLDVHYCHPNVEKWQVVGEIDIFHNIMYSLKQYYDRRDKLFATLISKNITTMNSHLVCAKSIFEIDSYLPCPLEMSYHPILIQSNLITPIEAKCLLTYINSFHVCPRTSILNQGR